MSSGHMFVKNQINVGFGMLLIMQQIRCSLMFLESEKMKSSKNLKHFLSPSVLRSFSQMIGGAYDRHLDEEKHEVGKRNTQKIERKNLNFRTWIKRLARKIICFSKSEKMHDIVIGLMINKIEFGIDIYPKSQV